MKETDKKILYQYLVKERRSCYEIKNAYDKILQEGNLEDWNVWAAYAVKKIYNHWAWSFLESTDCWYRRVLEKRKYALDAKFDFSDENIDKIIAVDKMIEAEMDSLYRRVQKVAQFFDEQYQKGNKKFSNYTIKADLCFYPEETDAQYSFWHTFSEMDVEDFHPIAWTFTHKKNETFSELDLNTKKQKCLYWGRGFLGNKKMEERKHCFCYLSDLLFGDNIMSFEDMIRVKENFLYPTITFDFTCPNSGPKAISAEEEKKWAKEYQEIYKSEINFYQN